MLTRRSLLRAGAGAALTAMVPLRDGGFAPLADAIAASAVRRPDSLPFPGVPAGEHTGAFPFDHIVVVMMENHSFDNYFGMLPRRGQPGADGFRFDRDGRPLNSNPYDGGRVRVFHRESRCQASVSQNWNSTHRQMNGGRMDGFARNRLASMAYWTDADIPFYYSLARTFTLADRWFGSAPCQTYPNRRFMLAGTAYGLISTDTGSFSDPPPPNGTIFDRLNAHGISWRNYFTDLPAVGIIPSALLGHPQALAPIPQFFADCAAGTLPAVSFVDTEFGLLGEVGGPLGDVPGLKPLADLISTTGGSEENPQDITFGETFASSVVNAVMASPAWRRTLLVWTYDEHGGYYDHVPPPRAIKPDSIKPRLSPGDEPGGYDVYGPRVPAVVVSPYSRPHAVSSTVYDHTSILATIERQWNLPACTFRDANAMHLGGCLDVRRAAFLEPPRLAGPGDLLESERTCSTADPRPPVERRR
jgi:phospholipase C